MKYQKEPLCGELLIMVLVPSYLRFDDCIQLSDHLGGYANGNNFYINEWILVLFAGTLFPLLHDD
ncbi:hypothetical protein [Paenisporosarcina sp.]|uniref:hypothetical protein n=1 Tax=Paenisporosarcina sp. TaxID=1932001 RepID=UPI003C733E78